MLFDVNQYLRVWLDDQIKEVEVLLALLRAARARLNHGSQSVEWMVRGVVDSQIYLSRFAEDPAAYHAVEASHYPDVIYRQAEERIYQGGEDAPCAAQAFVLKARRDPLLMRQLIMLARLVGHAPPRIHTTLQGTLAPAELPTGKKE